MSRDSRIKDVKPIRTAYYENEEEAKKWFVNIYAAEGAIPLNRDCIVHYADEPCVAACQRLYDLNIGTLSSNGHVDGAGTGIANVLINYDSLSHENRLVVDDLIRRGIIKEVAFDGHSGCYHISIETPINSGDLIGDVSDKLLNNANEFKYQDVLFGRYTLSELKDIKFKKINDDLYEDKITLEIISKDEIKERFLEYLKKDLSIGRYFTTDGELFFMSEDLLKKHNEYIESLNNLKKR